MAEDRGRPRRTGPPSSTRVVAQRQSVVQRDLENHAEECSTALGRSLRVLDLGGGTGGTAVPLAVAGHDVTVVDPSPDALFSLRRRATEHAVQGRVRALQGDTDTVTGLLGADAQAFDLVCLHGTLEVLEDPAAAVGAIAELLVPGGSFSLVVAQRLHAVLSRALAGELDRARAILERPDGRWGDGDPAPRRFDQATVLGLLAEHGFTPVHVQGVHVFADLVPSGLLDSEADRSSLAALEEAARAADHPLLGSLGSALHVLATRG